MIIVAFIFRKKKAGAHTLMQSFIFLEGEGRRTHFPVAPHFLEKIEESVR